MERRRKKTNEEKPEAGRGGQNPISQRRYRRNSSISNRNEIKKDKK